MNVLAQPRTDWLDPQRARLCNGVMATMMLAFVLAVAAVAFSHRADRPPAVDFAAFWAAARLAVEGHALRAYDPAAVETVERAAAFMPPGYLAFYYPPSFLLLLLPLGWLGYLAAWATFVVAETALAVAALRAILPRPWSWLPLLSFPGFLMNGISGQNAALSAACFAGAAVWLERRLLLAGACLGALTCKPQLAACVPIALAAAGRWRALASCGVAAGSLALASVAAFGAQAWLGFLRDTVLARSDIETISIKWPKMQSIFGAVRLAGGRIGAAYAVQTALSLISVTLLVLICRTRPGRLIEAAALAAASLLFTPFLYDYDLTIVAVPLACLAALAMQTRWRPWEKPVLASLFVLPLAARPAGLLLHATLAPPLLTGLIVLLALRTPQSAVGPVRAT